MIIDRNVESRHVRGRRRLPIFFASRSRGPLLENRTRPAPSRPLLRRTIRGGEFSRRKVPNVVADSSVISFSGSSSCVRAWARSRSRRYSVGPVFILGQLP